MDEERDPFKEMHDKRKMKKAQDAANTTTTLDAAATGLQFVGPAAPFAKGYKIARGVDNAVTGGKVTNLASRALNNPLTKPIVKPVSKIGGSKPVRDAMNIISLKDKLPGKGGGAKTTTTTTNVSGPTNAKGLKNSAVAADAGKKLGKEKKKQDSTSNIGNQSEKEKTGLESSSLSVLAGKMTLTTVIVSLSAGLLVFFVIFFVIIYNSLFDKENLNSALAFSEISSHMSVSEAAYSIKNISVIDKVMNFVKDDYDFKDYDESFNAPTDGSVPTSRDNSKLSSMLSWAKKQFPSTIYLSFFDIGNVFNYGQADCTGDECNGRAEVQFYQKVADISYRYRKLYNIELDWPLIMSTLLVRSADTEAVFASNLSGYSITDLNNLKKVMSLDWDYDYKNISGYDYLSPNDARYDLQILAKNMVKKKTVQTCTDAAGNVSKKLELEDVEDTLIESEKELYQNTSANQRANLSQKYYLVCNANQQYSISSTYTLDKEKYKEKLDDFIEARYLSNGNPAAGSGNGDSQTSIPYGNDMASTMINVATSQLGNKESDNSAEKYWKPYFNSRVGWCACFIDWVIRNTEYNGVHLYPDIIKSSNCGPITYMNFFNNSSDSNIKFYYNTKYSQYSGRGPSYTPKPGDIVFFSNTLSDGKTCKWNSPSDPNDKIAHVGIVTGTDGNKIYTIEGNTSHSVARRTHPLDTVNVNKQCVIGFGSWY